MLSPRLSKAYCAEHGVKRPEIPLHDVLHVWAWGDRRPAGTYNWSPGDDLSWEAQGYLTAFCSNIVSEEGGDCPLKEPRSFSSFS